MRRLLRASLLFLAAFVVAHSASAQTSGYICPGTTNLLGEASAPITTLPYTLQESDVCLLKIFNDASAGVVNLPAQPAKGFPPNYPVSLWNQGAGALTLTPQAPAVGVTPTINGQATIVLAQGQGATLAIGVDGNWYANTSGNTSGGSVAPFFNATGTLGYELNGMNGLSMSNAANEQSVFIAPFAGASQAAGSRFLYADGPNVFESLTAVNAESVGIGHNAGIAQTTPGGSLFAGISAGAGFTTQGAIALCGSDCARDAGGTGGAHVIVGNASLGDGAPSGPNDIFGTGTLLGNTGTITVSSGYTVGDILTLNITTSNACGTVNCTNIIQSTLPYTLVSGDTTATGLAAHLSTAWSGGGIIDYILGDGQSENAHDTFQFVLQYPDPTNHAGILTGHFPERWKLTLSVTCAGVCGGTAVYAAPGNYFNNVLVGNGIFGWKGASSLHDNVVVGGGTLGNAATTANTLALVGGGIAPNGTTLNQDAVVGTSAIQSCVTCAKEAIVGTFAGLLMTGDANSILSFEDSTAQGCITSGVENLEAGVDACVRSPTANGQMSLSNAILGANNTGTGSTLSTGAIGIEEVPTASTYTSTWLGGEAVVGTGSALATNGTANFFHLPFTAAAPTGTPANPLGDAVEYNAATHSINIYDATGAAWFHITLSASAG